MARLKQHMYQHLGSAKEWLTKAEEAFDKQHNIRGELDLMLAQAELQHVKETNRSGQWRYKYVIFRHGLALTLAVFMAVAVGGVYWWTTRSVLAVPVPLNTQANVPVEVSPKVEGTIPAQTNSVTIRAEDIPVEQVQVIKGRQTQSASPAPQVTQSKQSSDQAPAVLSDDEVQKLVRAAGKSLRGQ